MYMIMKCTVWQAYLYKCLFVLSIGHMGGDDRTGPTEGIKNELNMFISMF